MKMHLDIQVVLDSQVEVVALNGFLTAAVNLSYEEIEIYVVAVDSILFGVECTMTVLNRGLVTRPLYE